MFKINPIVQVLSFSGEISIYVSSRKRLCMNLEISLFVKMNVVIPITVINDGNKYIPTVQ